MMLVIRDQFFRYGVSFGTALAMVISYSHNHSVLWAIIHGVLGWLYIAYYVLTHA